MIHRRTVVRITLVAVLALLAASTGWAGRDWKEVPKPEEKMLEKEFQLDKDARLRVNVSDVDVQLIQTDGSSARVEIYATARNRDKARDYFDRLNFTVEKDDNTVNVQTRQSSFRVTWNSSSNSVNVRAVIRIPKGTDMHVRTSDGDIHADDLAGRLEARTSDGDIVLGSADGAAVLLRSSDGDIRVDRIHAADVEAHTADGDIRVETAEGEELTFSTSDGDVDIGNAKAESMYLKTSDGSIDVTAAAGKIRAHSSDGDIRVTLTGPTGLELTTSDGDIDIHVPHDMGADIDLKGENVHLTGGIDIQGEVSRERVRGALGKGGVGISARTSDGVVTLVRG